MELAASITEHGPASAKYNNSLLFSFQIWSKVTHFLSLVCPFYIMWFGGLFASFIAFGVANSRAITGAMPQQSCTFTLKANPNPSLDCGVYGTISSNITTIGSLSSTSDAAACAAACNAADDCISFGFTLTSHKRNCQLYGNPVKYHLNVSSTGPVLYYNRHCWMKSCTVGSAPSSAGCVCTSTTTSTVTAARGNRTSTYTVFDYATGPAAKATETITITQGELLIARISNWTNTASRFACPGLKQCHYDVNGHYD